MPLVPMLRSKDLWLSSLSQLGTNFGWVFILIGLPRYLKEVHQVADLDRGVMTSIPIAVGVLGMLGGGWLTDVLTRRIGRRWGRGLPMALTRFGAMLAYLACPLLGFSPWAITAALCVVAFATDLGTPPIWAYMQDMGGKHVGSILGWGNMWGNIGAALSPLVLTPIIDKLGWNECFLACGIAFLVSGVTALGINAALPILPPEVSPGEADKTSA